MKYPDTLDTDHIHAEQNPVKIRVKPNEETPKRLNENEKNIYILNYLKSTKCVSFS